MPINSAMLYVPGILTDLAIKALPGTYIADQVFPVVKVSTQAGIIPNIDPLGSLLREVSVEAAEGADPELIEFEVSKTLTYYCQKRQIAHRVTDEMLANAAEGMIRETLLQSGVLCAEYLLQHREISTVAAITSNWTGGSYTASPTLKWDGTDNGTPIADIVAKKVAITTAGRVSPNALALDELVLDMIFQTAEVQDKMVGGQIFIGDTTYRASTTEQRAQILAQLCGLQRVFVASNAFKNTAAKAATGSFSTIWGENVFLFRHDQPRGAYRGTGIHAAWNPGTGGEGGIVNGFRINQYRLDRADAVETKGRGYENRIITNKDSGFLWTNVLTASL